MSAPIGNKLWKLRSKHGRDRLFKSPKLLWQTACEYFQWCIDNPLMEVQQAKSTEKPYKDKETGEIVFPGNTIELPKMRPFTLGGMLIDTNTLLIHSGEQVSTWAVVLLSRSFDRPLIL